MKLKHWRAASHPTDRRVHSLVHPTIFALGVFALLGVSPTLARGGGQDWTPPTTLDEVNRELQGKLVTLVLASGEIISKALRVEVGPDITSWNRGKRSDQVPTSEVRRITARTRHRGLNGFALGALVGGSVALISESGGDDKDQFGGGFYGETSSGAAAVAGAIGGGLIGLAVGRAWKRAGRVVYQAPLEKYLRVENLNEEQEVD